MYTSLPDKACILKVIRHSFNRSNHYCLIGTDLHLFGSLLTVTDGHQGQGGNASRCSAGKDEPPPPRPVTGCSIQSCGTFHIRRWVPPSSIRRDALTPEEKQNVIFRKVRGILNKITPEKFQKLSKELLGIGLDSPAILKGVILLIFDKALEEPKYSSMYAQLCRIISEEAPNFETSNTNGPLNKTFCRLLLAKCQDEFENRRKASEAFDCKDGPLTPSEEEQRSVAKHKMLGNIKFICELGKQNLLQESILHLCIRQLLSKKKRDQSVQEKAEDLECLCQIMKTIGRLLDTEKAKSLMDQYFERMEYYSFSSELNSRIRFMLQDVLELRRNKWLPRRVQREHGPKTILQIREEAAKDYGVYLPPPQYTFGPLRGTAPLKHGQRMDDVFSPFQYGVNQYPLGTGPGAINDVSAYSTQRRVVSNIAIPHAVMLQTQNSSINNLQYGHNQTKRDNRQQAVNNVTTSATNNAPVSGRELPPRFLKLQQQQQQIQQLHQQQQQPIANQVIAGNQAPIATTVNPLSSLANHHHNLDGGISLRPAQNSMVLKPNIVMNKTASNTTINVNNSNLGKNFDNTLLIKSNKQLNNKPLINTNDIINNSKNVVNHTNKDAILKMTEEALNEFLSENQNMDDVILKLKQMKIPKNFQQDVLVTIMRKSLNKTEAERETASKLITCLKTEEVISSNIFMNAFNDIINEMDALETDIPRVKSYVAAFISTAISDNVITIKEASEPLEGGQHYPLFLLCLQHLHKTKGQVWLFENLTESKINLISMLPENDRNKERLADILEDRALSFLYPMLRIESDLWKQLTHTDCTPTSLYRWVKENVDINLQNSVEFIQVLFTCLLKHITTEVSKISLSENENQQQTQTNGTNISDNEKETLSKFQHFLKAFLHEKTALQLMLLYALQSYCFGLGFPKGMLLRWFVMLYDLEIVDEEVFMKWREDINDEFPGKGKALFQVNQWLTWLEEAEEEDDDEGVEIAK